MTDQVAWVTGACGFIGRHLVADLGAAGWRVVCFGRGQSADGGRQLLPVDEDGLTGALAAAGTPDRIYHLAGGATVGASFADPLADFESNVATTARLLDVVRRYSPDSLVVLASSSAVYGSRHQSPIAVASTAEPYSPYGHHKHLAENLALSYVENFKLRITVMRLFSIYGPGLRKQLMFDICSQLSRMSGPLRLAGTGGEMRDWCHVSDAVKAMKNLKTPDVAAFEIYNVGTSRGSSIRAIAELLVGAWGEEREIEFSGISRVGDPFSLVASPESLPPHFTPDVTLEDGVLDFVGGFRVRLEG